MKTEDRRKAIALGLLAGVWASPVITVVNLPAHAQTSEPVILKDPNGGSRLPLVDFPGDEGDPCCQRKGPPDFGDDAIGKGGG